MLYLVVAISLWMISITKNVALDNNLRLYDSFAEIHQVYNGPLRFHQADWDNIKHESIVLRLASEREDLTTSFERRITRIQINMTGRSIKYSSNSVENVFSSFRKNSSSTKIF
jgi:hypothetical protein